MRLEKKLVKHRFAMISLVLLSFFLPFAYAGAYGAGAYSAGDYGVGEVPTTTSGSSSGEGGEGLRHPEPAPAECYFDIDCKEGEYCSGGKCYEPKCSSDSECNQKEGEVCLNMQCVKLFDIKITEFESKVELGSDFEFSYLIKGMANISGDVEVHFWIEKDDEIVTSGHDTIFIGNYEEKTEKTKLYMPTNVNSGVYTFFVQLIHKNYQANSHRTIEIFVDKEGVATIIGLAEKEAGYWIYILTGIAVLLVLAVFLIERKRSLKGWIKKHKFSLSLALIFLVGGILTYTLMPGTFPKTYFSKFLYDSIYFIKRNVFYAGLAVSLLIILAGAVLLKKQIKRIKYAKIKKEKIKKTKEKPNRRLFWMFFFFGVLIIAVILYFKGVRIASLPVREFLYIIFQKLRENLYYVLGVSGGLILLIALLIIIFKLKKIKKKPRRNQLKKQNI